MNVQRIFSVGLAAVLQVLPLTRGVVALVPATSSSYAIFATWIAGVAALMGSVDAVSGASTTITSAKTATATNGVPFSYRITTGPDVANTFAATPLPTGLTVSTASGRITGTPTVTGVYVIHLTASDGGRADRTVTADLTLTILAGGGGGAIPPTITTQPASQTVTAGANVNFSVAASGTAPLRYQWRLNAANIANATNATLSLMSVTTAQSGGSYSCVVSNSAGAATSSAAVLTVNPAVVAPTITVQPTGQTVTAGANVGFTVAASGTAPLRYQWRLNGANIGGATNATLTLNSVTISQSGGSYSCVISNLAGTATSSAAVLMVNPAIIAPAITTQPANQSVTAGANAAFTVVASGTAPLSYQWRLNGVNLAGATSATLTLNGVTIGQSGGSYSCVVTNAAGSATSSAAVLTVTAAAVAPTITTQPVNQTVTAGNNASFSVVASGTAPLSYQWRLNSANIAGATSATLALTGVTIGQSGGSYSCVVSNVAGTATSSAAILTANPAPIAPTITSQPVAQTVTAGANVSFTVAATGTAPLSYQWRLNGVNLAGATSGILTLTGVTTNQGGSYSCLVSNVAGVVTSASATLTVNPAPIAPTITLQPASQTVMAGANVSFTVAATGTGPLSFQWRLNGANLPGATSATLTLPGVAIGQAGNYSCVVANAGGSAMSATAVLTVNTVAAQPSKLTINISGLGQVLPNLNGANLTIGKVYTVSAFPGAGQVFSGWEREAQPLSASAMISFVMTSNLVLAANFTPDPLVAVAGIYNGLFYESAEVRLGSTGPFCVGVGAAGNFSGWVQIGYARYQFAGTLDANFQATSTVARWNALPLTVQFTIGRGAEAGRIYGTVTDGIWTAPLSGGRSPASSPYAGEYTVAIPGATGSANLPAGDGYAALHVAADGLGTINGLLADGTPILQSAYVTADGDWPLYVSMYVGKGAMVGWLTFTNLATSDVSGDLVWIKQAGASATSFPLGFTNGTKAVGSIYVAPGAVGKAVNLSSAVVRFSGGSLAASFENVVSVNTGSQVVNLGPNQMTLGLIPATGLFTGQVSAPGNGTTHNFGGVILQKQNAGYGTMAGTPNGSRVVMAAP